MLRINLINIKIEVHQQHYRHVCMQVKGSRPSFQGLSQLSNQVLVFYTKSLLNYSETVMCSDWATSILNKLYLATACIFQHNLFVELPFFSFPDLFYFLFFNLFKFCSLKFNPWGSHWFRKIKEKGSGTSVHLPIN